jgi:hypothetical protein
MARKPEPPPLSSWDVFKIASKTARPMKARDYEPGAKFNVVRLPTDLARQQAAARLQRASTLCPNSRGN